MFQNSFTLNLFFNGLTSGLQNENAMMTWTNCYSGERFGQVSTEHTVRTEFERDWDRIIFSSAFRRLQNKTQVFPLPEEVFVHNRLTHSLEVASVGRSLGELIGRIISLRPEIKSDLNASEFYKYHLKHVVASACLAHDLGNPAFGHSGEEAISQYFKNRENEIEFRSLFNANEWSDLTAFEGNANALRLLTRQFNGRLNGGFRLTYSTLGAILKYPCESIASLGKKGPKSRSKYGFFQSDKHAFLDIAARLNMIEDQADGQIVYKRNPFVYIVEAADDICYSIIDVEDAHRLGIFSTEKVIYLLKKIILLNPREEEERVNRLLELVLDDNEKIAYLRAKSINALTLLCSEVFEKNMDAILSGSFEGDLINGNQDVSIVMKEIGAESVKYIYNYPSVIKIELSGFRIMAGLLEDFVEAALTDKSRRSSRHKNLLSIIPSQYHFNEDESPYEKVMSIIDFASGMTDLYALQLYRNLRGIEMPRI
jgi:dGTPase